MASFLNYNGNIISKSNLSISAQNQISQFGVFETMRFSCGKIKNFTDHFNRLIEGINLLKLNIPYFYNQLFFESEIDKLIKVCSYNFARLRLSVLEIPQDDLLKKISFIIEASPLQSESGSWQNKDLTTSIYSDYNIMASDLSAIKHNNRLPYIMAQKFCTENNFQDVFLLNQYGRICDSTIANIFIIKNNIISTPPLVEGCIAGIMRKNIINAAKSLGIEVVETPIKIETMAEADEIFITNSIINMKPVSSFNDKKLQSKLSFNLYSKIKNCSDLFD